MIEVTVNHRESSIAKPKFKLKILTEFTENLSVFSLGLGRFLSRNIIKIFIIFDENSQQYYYLRHSNIPLSVTKVTVK